MWTNFYDDYIVFSRPGLDQSPSQASEFLFKLTGWIFAESGTECEALGVKFSMSVPGRDHCLISNTTRRISEICSELDEILAGQSLNKLRAQKLRGRLQFADGQLYGRIGKRCFRVLSQFAAGQKFKLDDNDKFFLACFRNMLKSGRPREVRRARALSCLIFTDACYERDAALWVSGIGGILVKPGCESRQYFSVELTDQQRMQLGELKKKQIIFEAETLAALIGFLLCAMKSVLTNAY